MAGSALHRCGQPEDLAFRVWKDRRNLANLGTTDGEGAGLVEDRGIDTSSGT
jgi:hypothetical protein